MEPQQQQEIVLKFISVELNIIGLALSNLPYKDVAPILEKIKNQIQEQTSSPQNGQIS